MRKKSGISWGTFFVCLILAVGILSWIILVANAHSEDTRFDREKNYPVTEGWSAVTSRTVQEVTLPAHVEADAGEVVAFSRILGQKDINADTILFRSYHQFVRVFLDGEQIFAYGQDSVSRMHPSPGCVWQLVRLPQDYAGKELRIELESVYPEYAGQCSEVRIGTRSSLLFWIVRRTIAAVFLNIPIVIMGIILLLCSFIFQDRESVRKVRSLGLLCIALSSWILLESRMVQFITGNVPAAIAVLFVIFDAVPVFAIYYLNSYPEFQKRKGMRILYGASIVNYILSQLLTLLGLEGGIKGVWRVHLLIVLLLGEFLYVYVDATRKKRISEEKYVFSAAFILCCFGFIDILKFYVISRQSDAVYFTRIGLIGFVMILGVSVLLREGKRRIENVEKKVLEKIAYSDMMTGMENRTAFEEKMQHYREAGIPGQLFVMVSDLNGLKYINDNYGHSMGDLAIRRMGGCLKEYFEKCGSCYRIGGDEFCVLAEVEEDESCCRQQVAKFKAALSSEWLTEGLRVEAACGWTLAAEDIDRAFTEADSRMYEDKKIMQGSSREGNYSRERTSVLSGGGRK